MKISMFYVIEVKYFYLIVLLLYEKDKGMKLSFFFNGNRNIYFESLVVLECRCVGNLFNKLSIFKYVWS